VKGIKQIKGPHHYQGQASSTRKNLYHICHSETSPIPIMGFPSPAPIIASNIARRPPHDTKLHQTPPRIHPSSVSPKKVRIPRTAAKLPHLITDEFACHHNHWELVVPPYYQGKRPMNLANNDNTKN
jgi:hypothetical protein